VDESSPIIETPSRAVLALSKTILLKSTIFKLPAFGGDPEKALAAHVLSATVNWFSFMTPYPSVKYLKVKRTSGMHPPLTERFLPGA
jgi:hypothetical protein